MQWLSKQNPISGTSTNGMKAEKRNTIVPLQKWMLYVEYYMDLASSYFLSAKTLNSLHYKKSVSGARTGSSSFLHHAHDSSRTSQASFSVRGIKDAQKQTVEPQPACCEAQLPSSPSEPPWLLVIPWCRSLHCPGVRGRAISAASLCWPSLFSILPT